MCSFINSFEDDRSHELLYPLVRHNSDNFLGVTFCVVEDHVEWH
jgi:hypothetical protein